MFLLQTGQAGGLTYAGEMEELHPSGRHMTWDPSLKRNLGASESNAVFGTARKEQKEHKGENTIEHMREKSAATR